jgi:hypothetical protein
MDPQQFILKKGWHPILRRSLYEVGPGLGIMEQHELGDGGKNSGFFKTPVFP